jgi:type I restriction enzyme M protein
MAKKTKETKEQPLETTLWAAADKLRKNMDAAEYKHIALGLIFLKYISDAFEEHRAELAQIKGANPDDRDEYSGDNIFFVPKKARWSFIQTRAKLPTIGKDIDDAMDAIEKENATLRGVLPKDFARPNLDQQSLGGLIDLVSSIDLGSKQAQQGDVLGRVYEYFLGQFALAEGKKGGQFYTPRSVVTLLVEMLEPYKGRVFDPCCGSGGMFVQSEKFLAKHHGRKEDLSVLGQESNQTTYRLCRMNLAIRGIDGSNIRWNSEGSFLKDLFPDLKADYILANPPFNDSDWNGELLRDDVRWKYGVPPEGNANFAWMQHFVYHLAYGGTAGIVLAKGSLSSRTGGEGEIRKNLIEARVIDCIVNLPTQLFLNTPIPACLWFLSRAKANGKFRHRENEVLFIDARNMGFLLNRKTRDLSAEDMNRITGTYHEWRNKNGKYKDVAGFCKSATLDEIAALNHVLTPGRYIGLPDDEDDFNFDDRFTELKAELKKQFAEEDALNETIQKNLAKVKANG